MADDFDAATRFARKLRQISSRVKEWEDRDLREQTKAGNRSISRPAYFADLDELASILEGKNRRFYATITPTQNWPATVERFQRDIEIAELVHDYRIAPDRKVKDGWAAAADQFGIGLDAVKRADRLLGPYLRAGNQRLAFPILALEAARFADKKRPEKG